MFEETSTGVSDVKAREEDDGLCDGVLGQAEQDPRGLGQKTAGESEGGFERRWNAIILGGRRHELGCGREWIGQERWRG